jgi:glycosyltransferase involved in cell wall biosynthesis
MTVSANMISSPNALSSPGIKVMHVRASNFFGGPEKQIIEHLRLLGRTQAQPLLCSFYEKGGETELAVRAKALGIPSFSIPCLNAYDPRQVLYLRSLFSREQPQIVCTHDYRSTFLTLIGRTRLAIRQVAFWRGVTRENPKVALYYRVESYLLRAMDHVVVVSGEQHSFLTSRVFPESAVSLVPNAVQVESNEGRGGDGHAGRRAVFFERFRGKEIIATAGRLSPEKGHRYLIEAMSSILAGRKNIILLIFGDGPRRDELTRLARKLGCSGSIYFVGFVPDFSQLLEQIDLFVLPSLSEGLPNVVLEALAAGKPVVGTAVGGVPELIANGETGLLVPPRDSGQLAQAITKLLDDRTLARRLGQAGQELVRKTYSFERQCHLMMQVYKKVLGTKQR